MKKIGKIVSMSRHTNHKARFLGCFLFFGCSGGDGGGEGGKFARGGYGGCQGPAPISSPCKLPLEQGEVLKLIEGRRCIMRWMVLGKVRVRNGKMVGGWGEEKIQGVWSVQGN
jgi:hypothetical protein